MKFSFRPTLALVVGLLLAPAGALFAQASQSASRPAPAAPASVAPDTVVLTVGAEKVTAREFDAIIASLPPQEQAGARAHEREVADQYAQVSALSQAAVARHLDRSTAFETEMRLEREKALTDALITQLRAAAAPSDAAVAAYYQAHAADFQQVKARHILVTDSATPRANSKRTRAEAEAKINALAARLKKGESFAALARAESDDPGSKAKGGDLGYLSHGETVPAFDHMLWTLKPGQTSAPFETPYGFHILQVEAVRTVPLAEVKSRISDQLAAEKVRGQVRAILAAATPQFNPQFFGPAAAPAAAPGAR